MNDWTISTEHPGYRCKTIGYGACTVTIFRPELSDEERVKRESHVRTVAENALKHYLIGKETKHEQHHH